MGDDGQGRTLFSRVQVTACGAGATAVRRDGTVHRAEAFLLVAVQVFGTWVTGLYAGFNHGVEQRVVARFRRGHADRAVATVPIVGADVAGFGFAEIRQAVQVGPVFQARQLRPVVVVHGVAADVAHAVDQGRTTQALAAPAFHPAAVHVWLWIGFVGPVVAAALQRESQGGWHLGAEVEAVVRATGLQQQNSDAFVFGQTGRQGVTGRAGTHNDVIVFLGHECTLVKWVQAAFVARELAPVRLRSSRKISARVLSERTTGSGMGLLRSPAGASSLATEEHSRPIRC